MTGDLCVIVERDLASKSRADAYRAIVQNEALIGLSAIPQGEFRVLLQVKAAAGIAFNCVRTIAGAELDLRCAKRYDTVRRLWDSVDGEAHIVRDGRLSEG